MANGERSVSAPTYKVSVEAAPGAPVVRVEQSGPARTLTLNTAHPFFPELYAARDSSYRVRNAIEVMLFALLDSALHEGDDALSPAAICRWSERMSIALPRLAEFAHQPVALAGHHSNLCRRRDQRHVVGNRVGDLP